MKRTGRQFLIVVLIVLAELMFVQCGKSRSPVETEERQPAQDTPLVRITAAAMKQAGVEVGEVRSRLILDTVRTTGVVSPDQDSISRIRPLTRGRIEKVFVGLGDYVQEGSALAEYDNIELGATAGEYRIQWSELQRDLSQKLVAERSFARAKELLELQAISQREFDVREAELKAAQSAETSRRANLAALEDKLSRFGMQEKEIDQLRYRDRSGGDGHFSHTTLRSPVEGVVVKREVVVGEAVDFEKELFTIVNVSHVWVQANIAEKDLSKIRLGNKVQVRTSAFPEEVFRGRTTSISDMLDPETRVIKVRCVVPNPHRKLKLDMFVDVEIEAVGQRRALMVPHSALLGDRDTYYVFVERGPGEFEKRVVRIAAEHTDFTEVVEGLKEGEQVALKGAFYLKSESQRESIGGQE